MADTSDIKNGLCFELKSQLYKVVEFLHVKPGKGAAFVRTKIKNLNNGKTIDHTFNAGTKINVVRIENRDSVFITKCAIDNSVDHKSQNQYLISNDQVHNKSNHTCHKDLST